MSNTTSDWSGWQSRFAERAGRGLPELAGDYDYSRLPASLARSIAVFQLGESGGGTVVDQARRSRLPGIDDSYADALRLFVAEEHRHASLLAMAVRLLGGELLRRNWTDRLFVVGRRLLGLRLKILVLLAAEVIGTCYYRLIAERLPPGVLRQWLEEIAEDEQSHLAFHCAFFRILVRGPLSAFLFRVTWRALIATAGWVMRIDHHKTLRDMHIDAYSLRASWKTQARLVESLVLRDPRPRPAATACAEGPGAGH